MTADERATQVEPVVKELDVPLTVERAFELFTRGIGGWWPLASHSVARERAVDCRFEPMVGGRLLETAEDGSQHVWGTLLAWEPPTRLVLTWHPGRSADTAQEISVTFSPAADGTTRLRLVHSGWERRADGAPEERESYDSGWDFVLGRYLAGAT